MNKVEDESYDDTKEIAELYFDIFENHGETLVYYLAETATLDWFGQTVKGPKNIALFIKEKVGKIRHVFHNYIRLPKIGYRESHVIKVSNCDVRTKPVFNEGLKAPKVAAHKDGFSTPSSSSSYVEKGQGDGLHNCPVLESPTKKTKLSDEIASPKVICISTTGHVEFQKKSTKKLQAESKWQRPCKLEFAYSGTNKQNFLLYLIIYHGNTKCRRNLLKEFEAGEPDN